MLYHNIRTLCIDHNCRSLTRVPHPRNSTTYVLPHFFFSTPLRDSRERRNHLLYLVSLPVRKTRGYKMKKGAAHPATLQPKKSARGSDHHGRISAEAQVADSAHQIVAHRAFHSVSRKMSERRQNNT
jgi:hypothetical protein